MLSFYPNEPSRKDFFLNGNLSNECGVTLKCLSSIYFCRSWIRGNLQCYNHGGCLVSGAALVRVDHDVGQSVAPFPPGAQVSSVSLNLVEPLLGARFVRRTENE